MTTRIVAMPVVWGVLALVSAGCVLPYRPPTADQPHAVVKIRRVYQDRGGTTLRETVLVDGNRALSGSVPSSLAETPRADAVLVHPRPATLEVSSGFFHTESKTVQEIYYEQVPYHATESYSCGSYSSGHYSSQMCTRSVTKYRSEQKTRWVTKSVEVDDGSCTGAVALAPVVGHVYLIEYRYQGAGVCELACFEQTPAGPESFQNVRCPVPQPG